MVRIWWLMGGSAVFEESGIFESGDLDAERCI
jgi:hypothetical protein